MNLQNAKLGMVIVDLQNDFLAPDGAYARGNTLSAEAVQLPARMAPVARAIKARGGLVTASLFTLWPNAQGEPMISAHLKERRPFLRQGDFAPGSRGQANVDVLAPSTRSSTGCSKNRASTPWWSAASSPTVAWPARCAMRMCVTTTPSCCRTAVLPSVRPHTRPRWPTWPRWPRSWTAPRF
jgi:hypothetical protein